MLEGQTGTRPDHVARSRVKDPRIEVFKREIQTRTANFFELWLQREIKAGKNHQDDLEGSSKLLSPLEIAEEVVGRSLPGLTVGEAVLIGKEIFSNLQHIAEQAQAGEVDRQVVERFFEKVAGRFFSNSDNAFDLASVQDCIRFMRATEEIDSLDPFYSLAYAAATYDFSFSIHPDQTRDLLLEGSPGDRLASWHFIRIIALADTSYSNRSRRSIRQTLNALHDQDISYFEALLRDTILADITEREAGNDDLTDSQLAARDESRERKQEDEALSGAVKASDGSCISHFLYPVARDALASMNVHGSLQGIAFVDVGRLHKEGAGSLKEFDEVIATIENKPSARRTREEWGSLRAYAETHLKKKVTLGQLFQDEALEQKIYRHAQSELKRRGKERLFLDLKPLKYILEPPPHQSSEASSDDAAALLRELHRPLMRGWVERDLGVRLTELSWREQTQLLGYLAQADAAKAKQTFAIIQRFGLACARTFLACEYGEQYGDKILRIANAADPATAEQLFASFSGIVDTAEHSSAYIAEQIHTIAGGGDKHSASTIFARLMERGRDLVREGAAAVKHPKHLEKLLAELQRESETQRILRAQFMNVARVLEHEGETLVDHEKAERAMLRAMQNKGQYPVFLRALNAIDRLWPIPEIHWRVDRTTAEYNQRFGIDLLAWLAEAQDQRNKKVLLELGPGSGTSKRERAEAGLARHYHEFSLSDNVYYSLERVFAQVIDVEALKADTGHAFTAEDIQAIAEFLYKSAVIKADQTGRDEVAYDEGIMQTATEDINQLKQHVPNILHKLRDVRLIPSTISTRNAAGQVIYPYKIKLAEQTPAVQAALRALASDQGERYINSDQDWYEVIDVFPPGTVTGSFAELARLAPAQIDRAIAVRSTVYERDADYLAYLNNVITLLKDDGILIDDSVRDNDGWYYRLGELKTFADSYRNTHPGQSPDIRIVLGPGFKGEDYRQDKVPLAFILGKDRNATAEVETHLLPGYEVQSLEELLKNRRYLESLDATGRTAERARWQEWDEAWKQAA